MEVWRKKTCWRDKENAIFTFISGHVDVSILNLNENLFKEKARQNYGIREEDIYSA